MTRNKQHVPWIRDLVNVVASILLKIFKTQESAIAVIIVMNRQLFCAK